MNRRRVLLGLTAGIPFLAGCSTYFDTDGNDMTTQSPTTTTVAKTARTTATQTPVPTDTATPPSSPDSWPTATAGESKPDFSSRETYANDRYAYTIEYPSGWEINATDPSAVTIESGIGVMVVNVREDIPSSLTLEEIIPVFVGGYKDSIEEEGGSVEKLGQRNETLPNGHNSKMIDLRMEQATNVFQQKMLLTVANDIMYAAIIMVSDTVYTTDVEKRMESMLLTLSISESNVQTESSGVRV